MFARHKRRWMAAAALTVAAASLILFALWPRQPVLSLVMKDAETGQAYLEAPLAEDGLFSISFLHSVNKTPVEEYYQGYPDGRIILIKARYMGFGAGVATELTGEQTLSYDEEGFMIIGNMSVPIDTLAYRIGTVSDHHLHIGGESWQLKALAPSRTGVIFEVHSGR